MRRYVSADYLFPVNTPPIRNGVVVMDEEGEIIKLISDEQVPSGISVEEHRGIIVPGFVNSHCHLELSYLHKQIPSETGLIDFIRSVTSERSVDQRAIDTAIKEADKAMQKEGIVVVGDIANTLNSRQVKLDSPIHYHTFAEVFNFNPDEAKETFKKGNDLCEAFSPLSSSITPHAPYSVTKELFRYIKSFCDDGHNLISIHNQESEEENKLYRYKTGAFVNFYESLKKDIGFFKAQARNSLRSILPLLPESQRILLVHNTYTSFKDNNFVDRYKRDVTWCLCPNANLYIESRLPNIDLFIRSRRPVVLGTDSLASNDKLSILSEIKTLLKNSSNLSLELAIKWATINGAKYFGVDDVYGSLEPGKKPGVNLLTNNKGLNITEATEVVKLA